MKRPLVALLTDFGTEDGYVAAMKGRIKSIAPNADIIDISHHIAPFNIRQGAFCLNTCYPYFPDKSIFVAVVDPGVGTARRGVVVKSSKHYFVGPDNGLFSFVCYREGCQTFEIQHDGFDHPVSSTFHGRDVFAPVAAWIAKGQDVEPHLKAVESPESFIRPIRKISRNEFLTEVLHIDHFGNIILGLHIDEWQSMEIDALPTVEFGSVKLSGLVQTFGEVQKGQLCLMWDSSGFLQIANYMDSAAAGLNAAVGDDIRIIL